MVNPNRVFSAIVGNRSLKDCCAVFFRYKKIDQFPQHLDAPKLRFLLLNLQDDLDFSHASFEGRKELKVISVICNGFPNAMSLPSSTHCFNILHTLRLVNQKIVDISFFEDLTRLKILDLAGSVFKKLPNGIADKNSELKLMDLSDCKIEEKEDCSEVIGRCSQLQELYMPSGIALPYECFMCATFPKLQRYRLNIYNHNFEQYDGFQFDCPREFRVVSIGNMNISNLCRKVEDLLKRASSVCVYGLVGGCNSIIPAFGRTNELTRLPLYSCLEIECIIDKTTSDNADSFRVEANFPSLGCAFEKLKYLSIEDCPNLKSLFPSSVAQSLPQLEDLNISNCPELKHIIVKEENGIDADEMEIFPNLKHINIDGCIDLEYIFPISVARTLLSLEYMVICGYRQLKHIIVKEENGIDVDEMQIDSAEGLEEIMTENEESHNQSNSQPYFPKLRVDSDGM